MTKMIYDKPDDSTPQSGPALLQQLLPALTWLRTYRSADLARDLLAGLFVAVLLVPQAMAYAALAELPPRIGLYASIVPPLLYALFGASRFLALGPVALVSLLVADTLGQVGNTHSIDPLVAAAALAALVGMLLLALGLLRLGFIVNFISDAVLTGFTSAAAVLIAASQLRHLLGLDLERGGNFFTTLGQLGQHLSELNPVTTALGMGALLLLLAIDSLAPKGLARVGLGERLRTVIGKSAPLLVVIAATLLVWQMALQQRFSVAIVGELDAGLPPTRLPLLAPEMWLSLLPGAVVIALIIFVTAMAVARALAGSRRRRLFPNREACTLGLANLGAAVTGAYPVGASLSRSALNFEVGARTPLASVVTALLVLLTAVFLGPLFYYLPKALLAALVMNAVIHLFDLREMRRILRYSPTEVLTLGAAFLGVLGLGVHGGLALGAAAGLMLYLWRTSRPRITIEGRFGNSPVFRSGERADVAPEVSPVLVLRVDQDLYFANAGYCEQRALAEAAEHPDVNDLVLDLRSVAYIDHSGAKMLERLVTNLNKLGVAVSLSEVKQPLLEKLKQVGLDARLSTFTTTHEAVARLKNQGSAHGDAATLSAAEPK